MGLGVRVTRVLAMLLGVFFYCGLLGLWVRGYGCRWLVGIGFGVFLVWGYFYGAGGVDYVLFRGPLLWALTVRGPFRGPFRGPLLWWAVSWAITVVGRYCGSLL